MSLSLPARAPAVPARATGMGRFPVHGERRRTGPSAKGAARASAAATIEQNRTARPVMTRYDALRRLAPFAVAASLFAFLLAGCGGTRTTAAGGPALVTLRIGGESGTAAALASGRDVRPRAVPSTVARVVFTISGPGMETITHAVDTAGLSEIVVTLNVPKGLSRTFVVEAFDAGGIVRYRSEATYDLLADSVTLSIAMSVVAANPGLDNWAVVYFGAGSDLTGLAFGAGIFVGVDSSGLVYASADNGATWTQRAGVSRWLTDVTYGGGQFVAVGPFGGAGALLPTVFAATTDNLSVWTDRSGGIGNDLRAVAYGGGTFVAVGANMSAYYTDNLAAGWSAGQLSVTGQQTLSDVAYGEGTFVAVASDNVFTSTDGGRTWTAHAAPSANGGFDQVVFAGGVFVGLATDNTGSPRVYFSTDRGVTWTPEAAPLPPADTNFSLTSGGGAALIVASSGEVFLPSGRLDDPATTWSPLPLGSDPGVPYNMGLYCGTAGNGRYVVGGGYSTILRSGAL